MKSKQVQMRRSNQESNRNFVYWLTAFLLLATPSFSPAFSNPTGRPIYHVEFLTFRAGDSETRLEVYCQIPLESLNFSFKNYAFLSRYEISLELFDRSDNLVNKTAIRDSVKLESASQIDDLRPILIRFDLNLPAGDYRAVVRMNDLESSQDSKIELPIKIPDYDKPGLKVSDLQLANSITRNKNNTDLVKNNWGISPNVSHEFGAGQDAIYVYAELYNLKVLKNQTGKGLLSTFVIKNEAGEQVKVLTLDNIKLDKTSFLIAKIPVHELESGQYKLTMIVTDLDNGGQAEKSVLFNVIKPVLAVEQFK